MQRLALRSGRDWTGRFFAEIVSKAFLSGLVFLNRPNLIGQLEFGSGREVLHVVPEEPGRRQRLPPMVV